jgi:hypothetical protein
MKIDAYITVSKDGKVLKRVKAKSFIQAFIFGLFTQINGSQAACIDVGNAPRATQGYASNLNCVVPAGTKDRGIVVGTTSTPVVVTDYKLAAQNLTLTHGGSAVSGWGVVGNICQATLTRAFTNNTGGDIAIEEVGIYTYIWDGAALRYYCLERTILSFLIPNTETRTITYTIRVTV